ncbi:MAG: hypothetical protein EOO07_19130 [Chitinophagaceae bacterium]|nr:MAG: hypothetical protein EOO07_19130 [Chitinophagaceae bacterium]
MKSILFFLLLCSANWALACRCMTPTLQENIYSKDFIATAKILKINQDSSNQEYHEVEVELIELYKGVKVSKLKIWSAQMTSCSFYTPVGTTWLIFANYNKDKTLSFHYCSGSVQIDRIFDLAKYPQLDKNYASGINLKLDVLKFFRDKKLMPANKAQLKISYPSECFKKLKGFEGLKRDFAIYECTVNEDMSISSVKEITGFNNKKLSAKFLSCIKSELRNNDSNTKSISKKTKQLLVYYYYPAEKTDKSFVTTFDL